jgi:hypothetical protein
LEHLTPKLTLKSDSTGGEKKKLILNQVIWLK